MKDKRFLDGYLAALYDYAWWKDGEMQVGNCGTSYKDAKDAAVCKHCPPELESEYKFQAPNVIE